MTVLYSSLLSKGVDQNHIQFLKIPDNGDAHKIVIQYLRQLKNHNRTHFTKLESAIDDLDDLRNRRNEADYVTNINRIDVISSNCLIEAKRVILFLNTTFDQLNSELENRLTGI